MSVPPTAADDVRLPGWPPLTWVGIVRLGLVQTAIGAIFVLSTATLNRVMVVELALPAVLPGLLIGLHYATQVLRPALGHGSDRGGRRTPWIVGGMAVLAAGSILAASGTALMRDHLVLGIALAAPAFVLIGVGVGAAGTALFVLLGTRTAPARRPAAATLAHLMMIVGFIVTAGIAGKTLDPFSPPRLVAVAAAIGIACFVVASLAVLGLEGGGGGAGPRRETGAFGPALRQVWADPTARRFAVFIFVSMLAYGGEELMIEPFAGAVFGMSVGKTAKLSGALHAGSLVGMILVGGLASPLGQRLGSFGGSLFGSPLAGTILFSLLASLLRRRPVSLERWMAGGCIASAAALVALAISGVAGLGPLMPPTVFLLGLANGGYAIAAIAGMMQRVGAGGGESAGVRMGLWGAAQAVAFGSGGLAATLISDVARHLLGLQAAGYAIVFAAQATGFVVAAVIAARLQPSPDAVPVRLRLADQF